MWIADIKDINDRRKGTNTCVKRASFVEKSR